MDFEKFTERSKSVVQAAQTLALRHNHQFLQPEHLLKTLIDDDSGVVKNLIRAGGGRPEDVLSGVESLLAKIPSVEGSGAGQLHLSPNVAKIFDQAEQVMKKSGDAYVTLERLLQGITLVPQSDAAKLLQKNGVNAEKLNQAINSLRKGRTADSASSEDQFEALKKYTRDLTQAARDGKLDPVIGRDEEIRRT
ncbi:MAG: ATP-dependent chaperone ClpB, partial [Proteobacteria bacterium]|nr:ATP-dependent chaperone ClpB [Pseudomonadota bacterium]